jgi:hypothetical protein
VLVTNYADVLRDPRDWAQRTHAALRRAGVPVGTYSEDHVAASVDTSLRHSEFSGDDVHADPDVSAGQAELYDALAELEGMHDALAPPSLREETPTTDALIGERRRTFEIKDSLERQLAEERASRWQAKLRRLAGIGGTAR